MDEITKEKIECQKCWWVGTYDDLIAPTSDHEPSCPGCLGDDFLEIELDKPGISEPANTAFNTEQPPLDVYYDEV